MGVLQTAKEVDVQPKVIVDYFIYLREVCIVKIMQEGYNIIGGPGLIIRDRRK